MKQTALLSSTSAPAISLRDIEQCATGWLLDGQIRQLSTNTINIRRLVTEKLSWFLATNEYPTCGTLELRQFLAYVGLGHEQAGGRWGNAKRTRPVRPLTVLTYFGILRTFFRWMLDEGVITASPLESIAPPVARADQIQPFTTAEIEALLTEAKRTLHARRDEAIMLLLYDTGIRASELCALSVDDLDLSGRRCTVLGKGNKHRALYFGRRTAKALWQYLRESPREGDEPLFVSDRGTLAGEALTRSGLAQLVRRVGRTAKLRAKRCSPHTFRHTFAIQFLRAGGNVFSLKEILGHTTLAMVNRYVAIAEADIEHQQRLFSPGDRLGGVLSKRNGQATG
jgi:integrase/recombinase XerC